MKQKRSTPLLLTSSGLIMLVSLLAVLAHGSSGPVQAAPSACIAGPHTGVITISQEWCAQDSPHQLTGDVTVSPGVTLTIAPSVTVRGGSGIELTVQGHLQALGTPGEPITFTSVTDTGGGQWSGLVFAGGTGQLRHATVRYAGGATSAGARSNITVQGTLIGQLSLESCQVQDSAYAFGTEYGMYVDNSRAIISDTLFSGNGNGAAAPLYIIGADSVITMTENSFIGNSRDRVVLASGAMMGQDATLSPQSVLQGYELESDFTVPPTVTLTLEAGVTLMGGNDEELKVRGHLQALGTPGEPITFTSVADTGGGEWAGLVFDGGTGQLRHATMRYGGNGNSAGTRSNIAVQNTLAGHVSLESCQVQDSAYAFGTEYGMYVDNSRAIISDTLFSGNGNGAAAPLYIIGADSVITMTENSFIGNSRDRVVLVPGAMMNHDTTLTPQAVLQGYELENDFTVPPTVTLTLEPGVTLVGGDSVELEVQGHLQALGTPGEAITFTSVADTGGGEWAGLVFAGGTGQLRHATVRYGGNGNSAGTRSNIAVQGTLTGQLSLESCQVQDSAYAFGTEYGMYVDNGRAIISNTLFSGNGNGAAAPLYIIGADSVITMTENSFIGNSRDRVVLASGAMMGQDATLSPQSVLQGYELIDDLTVPPTVTLTLEPGVTFMGAAGIELEVQGHLQALGTPGQPITFTSVADTGGGEWAGLVFDGGTGQLRHTTVRYGGDGNSAGVASNIAVQNTLAGQVSLESCQVRDSGGSGNRGLEIQNGWVSVNDSTINGASLNVHVTGDSTVLIDNSVIEEASSHGILVEGDQAWLHVTNSMIVSNGAFTADGVRNTGEATVILSGDPNEGNFIAYNQVYGANQTGLTGRIIATYNYWGDPSGPIHLDNPGGAGDSVSDRVLFDPWLTEVPTATASTERFVQAVGPRYVSPGETVNFGYIVHNVLTETLSNTVVVAHPPEEVTYLQSTPGGEYWPDRHQVVWKLGDLAPGEVIHLVVQVRYNWGLAAHQMTYSNGSIVAENLASDLLDLDEYLIYEELTITSFEELSDQELAAIMLADSELNALYVDAQSQGFVYYGAARLEHLGDGRDQVSLPMIDTSKQGEEIFLHRIVDQAHRIHSFADYVLGNSPTASYEYVYQSGETTLWNPFGTLVGPVQRSADGTCTTLGCADYSYFDCLRNCLIKNIHSDQFNPAHSSACSSCYKYGAQAACNACAASMALWRSDIIKNSVDMCEKSCNLDEDGWKCDEPNRECSGSHQVLVTPCVDCEYDTQNNYLEPCGADERCILGKCEPYDHPTEVVTAHDPNDMLGPMDVIPNQTISYTIRYENVGEGTAYGVYVESELPALFDPSTLQIYDGGVFFSSPRVLLWEVGELGPGAGGQVSFEVQVPPDALSGTIILANATVTFPSVPETTPTNDVLTIVRDLVAYSQFVEAMAGFPVDITLTGLTPTGNALTFEILDEPLWGTLTGTLPNLVFVPTADYEGGDSFSFQVSDGIHSSFPAQVSVQVNSANRIYLPLVIRQ